MTTPEQITQYFTQGYAIELIAQATGYTVEQLRPFAPAAAVAPALPPRPAAGASSIAALAAKLGGAAFGTNPGGRKLLPGKHVVDLGEVSLKTGLQYGDRVVFEYTAVESTNPQTEIGGIYSFAPKTEEQHNYGPDDIKGLVALICEAVDPSSTVRTQFANEHLDQVIGAPQIGRGLRLGVTTCEKTSAAGNAFMKHERWEILAPGTIVGLATAPAALPAPAGLPPVPAGLPPMPPAPAPALPTLPGQPVPASWPAGTAPPPMPGIPGGPK